MDLVRIGGLTRVARLIVSCLEWGEFPTDELTEEMKQQFIRVWERAERIQVMKIFVSHLVNLKDLPSTGGIKHDKDVYYSPLAQVSGCVYASICGAVYADPSFIVDSLPKNEGAFMEYMEVLGGVSGVAKRILDLPTKPLVTTHYHSFGLIPCLISLVARGDELLQYKTKGIKYLDGGQEAGEAEAEEDEAAPVTRRRIMDLSVEKIFESERLAPAEMMQLASDTGLGLLCLIVQLVLYIIWGLRSYLRHLGDLPLRN